MLGRAPQRAVALRPLAAAGVYKTRCKGSSVGLCGGLGEWKEGSVRTTLGAMQDALTFEQARLVVVVYTSALVPIVLVPWLRSRQRIPSWIPVVYAGSFVVCALGWELWFTYGWWAGDPVDVRRAAALNAWIPMNINWLLNSLADAGTICLGGIYWVWRFRGRSYAAFSHWDWGAFGILLVWFLGQNIGVEMFLYHDQLAEGKPLSWAPLVPTGPWINPTLFQFNGRTITLQGQIAWVVMTPLFYGAVIAYVRRRQA